MKTRPLAGTALLIATALGSWSLPVLAPAAAASADIEVRSGHYVIDGAHSTAFFGIRHLGVANFYGRFNSISGDINLDADDAANCSIKVAIDPASLDTASEGRDKHIQGADFLDVDNYPLMGFESTAIATGEADHWTVTGKLTLHGKSHEITFDAELIGAGDTAFGDYRVGLEASFPVKRSDYGMDVMLDKLGDEIRFTLSLEAILKQG